MHMLCERCVYGGVEKKCDGWFCGGPAFKDIFFAKRAHKKANKTGKLKVGLYLP